MTICTAEGCTSKTHARHLCRVHYNAWCSAKNPTCSRDGCSRKSVARGLCHTHHKQWSRANPDRTRLDPKQLVLDSLPGTYAQLAAKSGLCYDTVLKVVRELREQKQMHVGDQIPPKRGTKGGKFAAVFVAGDGEDASVTAAQRRAHRLQCNRDSYHLRKVVATPQGPFAALFGVAA